MFEKAHGVVSTGGGGGVGCSEFAADLFLLTGISKSYENKRMQAQLWHSGGSSVAFAGDVVY
jgi:hypothetical protein